MLNRNLLRNTRICLFLFFSLLLYLPEALFSQVSMEKGLSRRYDHVIITGEKLKALNGVKVIRMRMLAYREAELVAVPFQVDEKNSAGEYIYDKGPKAKGWDTDNDLFAHSKEITPILDDNDEIVFMARDAGDRLDRAYTFKENPVVHEITLKDPLTGDRGWLYLAVYTEDTDPPPGSSESYVSFDADSGVIRTISYNCRHRLDMPAFIDYAGFQNYPVEEAGTLPDKDNLLDRIKFRLKMTALGGRVTLLDRNEENIASFTDAYKAGPVRIIQNLRNYFRVIGIRGPEIYMNRSFYPYLIRQDVNIFFPFKLDYFITEMKGRFSLDFLGLRDWTYLCDKYPVTILIDGNETEEIKQLKSIEDYSWFSLEGRDGIILARFDANGRARGKLKRNMYFVDDALLLDPPETFPGQSPNLGFSTSGWEDLKQWG